MDDKDIKSQEQRLQVLAALTSRLNLAAQMGQQYGGDRDIYQALGYPLTINYVDYLAKYMRQDIAKAIIDRPVNATWQGELEIMESDDDKETPLEKAWVELDNRLGITNRFVRLDKLSGIGQYGALLFGFSDTRNREMFKEPVQGKPQLLYIKPLGEGSAVISTWERRTSNPRFGLPVLYDVTVSDPSGLTSSTIKVHYTRILHVTDDTLESEIVGAPRLEVVYNRLLDLEKIVGGDAEMFWRGARPGFQGKVDDGYQMTPTMEEDLIDQIDEYEHNLRRILINKGVTYEAMTQAIADPASHVDTQITMIAAVKGIPKRILSGSERGELSSAEDKGEWLTLIQARRETFAEPRIVRPFIDKCIEFGVLPKPVGGQYTVVWRDLFSVSELQKVEIGQKRALALKDYLNAPGADYVVPPLAFTKWFLGFTDAQVELIEEMRKELASQEPEVTPEEEAQMREEEERRQAENQNEEGEER